MAYDWWKEYDRREEQVKEDIVAEMKDLFLGKKIKIRKGGKEQIITLTDIDWHGIYQHGPHFHDENGKIHHSDYNLPISIVEEEAPVA
jgi:hypothetical protein